MSSETLIEAVQYVLEDSERWLWKLLPSHRARLANAITYERENLDRAMHLLSEWVQSNAAGEATDLADETYEFLKLVGHYPA